MSLLARSATVSCTASRSLRRSPCITARPARRSIVSVRATGEEQGSPVSPVEPTNVTPENFGQKLDEATRGGEQPRNFWDVMAFSGPAPEAINGRLAMLGFTAALGAELATGQGVQEQFLQAWFPILGAGALFIIASLIPIVKGANLERKFSFWRPSAEIINGRAAMIGLVALFITEWVKGGALWHP